MTKKPKILDHCLLNPGSRFMVTKDVKETTFSPGSIGFMSFIKEADNDYQNVSYITTVVVRRGKGGIPRINVNGMSIPVFRDERMLEQENYLPLGRRHYLHIEKMPLEEKSLMDIDSLSFLGWACAQSKYMHHLIFNVTRPKAKRLWPSNNTNSPVGHASRFPEYFDGDKDNILEQYGHKDFREAFIKEIRHMESSLAKCVLLYQKNVAAILLNSAHFMKYTNEKYYEVTDKTLAKNTVKFFDEKYKWLGKMASVKTQKKKKG